MSFASLVLQVCAQWVSWPWSICWPRKAQAMLWLFLWVELQKPSCATQEPLLSSLNSVKVLWRWHWRQGGSPGSSALSSGYSVAPLQNGALSWKCVRRGSLFTLIASSYSLTLCLKGVWASRHILMGSVKTWNWRKNSKRPLSSAHYLVGWGSGEVGL